MIGGLRIEELEERIAPTAVTAGNSLTFTDGDGDQIRVTYLGTEGSQVDVTDVGGGAIGNGDSIGWLTVTDSDLSSILIVENLGGGNGRTDVVHGVRATTPGADMGLISLGVNSTGALAGAVDLGTGAQILSDGRLGSFILNGDIDFDSGGHLIDAEGDIGLVEVIGNMVLDGTGTALISAGAGAGGGNISFITVGGAITEGDAGPAITPQAIGAGVTIADDAGDGTTGTLTVKITGTGAAGTVTAIPVTGGGAVVSRVDVANAAAVAITAAGAGGDVSQIIAPDAVGAVTVSGAADTDLYWLEAADIGTVANKSVGGDIVGMDSGAGIDSVTTLRMSVLGAAFTGTGSNKVPLVAGGDFMQAYGTVATGAIGVINTGGVYNTSILGASLGALNANPGGITYSAVDIEGPIGTIIGAYITDSAIYGQDGIGVMKIGVGGIMNSELRAPGGFASIVSRGAITDTDILASFQDAGGVFGGAIGTLQAAGVYNSVITAFGGFTKVAIKGSFNESDLLARFADPVLATNVGGGIGSFSAFGVGLASRIIAFGDIASVSIGTGGLVDSSIVDTSGSLLKASIKGDMADTSIINIAGNVGSVMISGDFAYNSRIASQGDFGSLSISGAVVGSDVIVIGSMGKFACRGGVNGLGTTFAVAGNLGSFTVNGGLFGIGAGPTLIQVDGSLGKMSVAGGGTNAVIDVDGDLGTLSIAAKGILYTSLIEVGGNLGSAKLQVANTDLTVAGSAGKLAIVSDAPSVTIAVGGSLGSLSVGGSFPNGGLAVGGNTGSVAIRGDASNMTFVFGQDGFPITMGSFSIGGTLGSSSIDLWGNLAKFSVRGSMVSAGFTAHGDVDNMAISRGIYSAYLSVQGATLKFAVNNAIHDASTYFYDGVASYAVRGSIYNATIATTNYNGVGAPQGGAIGKLTAQDINNSAVSAYGGIVSMAVKGTIYDSTIETAGRADSGAGAIVGGGGIGALSAKGLNFTDVLAYTNITKVSLGDEGMSAGSTLATVVGDLGSFLTKGLIFGDMTIGGNVIGSILSAGDDAWAPSTGVDFYFLDSNSVLTGGTLDVTGTIGGLVS